MLVFLKNTGVSTGDCMLYQLVGANSEKGRCYAKNYKKIISASFENVEIQSTDNYLKSKNARNLLPVDYVAEFFDRS